MRVAEVPTHLRESLPVEVRSLAVARRIRCDPKVRRIRPPA
jgi:hypothetical protein